MWHKKLGVSYGICSISQGRLFQFDRYRDKARLTCMKPETGDEVWRFEYSRVYEDMFGYDNGPRCCPVVDDDRVYTFGVEGMLYCVRVADGKEIWKVDTAKDFGVVQNFFGVGSTPLIEGDLLIVKVGGSPPDSPQEVRSGRVFGKDSGHRGIRQAHGQGEVQDLRRIGQLLQPGSCDDRRPAAVFLPLPRRPVGV